jgi:hypothetical protein
MKHRIGSASMTLVLALGSVLGLAGGGYMLATGQSVCTLIHGCDEAAKTAVTTVADAGKTGCCSTGTAGAAVVNAADVASGGCQNKSKEACDNGRAKTVALIAAVESVDSAGACPLGQSIVIAAGNAKARMIAAADVVPAADTNVCSAKAASTCTKDASVVNAAETKSTCTAAAATCTKEAVALNAAEAKSECSKTAPEGQTVVLMADGTGAGKSCCGETSKSAAVVNAAQSKADCATACAKGAAVVAAADAAQCSKSACTKDATVVAAADKADCSNVCPVAREKTIALIKAVEAVDATGCCPMGAAIVAAAQNAKARMGLTEVTAAPAPVQTTERTAG